MHACGQEFKDLIMDRGRLKDLHRCKKRCDNISTVNHYLVECPAGIDSCQGSSQDLGCRSVSGYRGPIPWYISVIHDMLRGLEGATRTEVRAYLLQVAAKRLVDAVAGWMSMHMPYRSSVQSLSSSGKGTRI